MESETNSGSNSDEFLNKGVGDGNPDGDEDLLSNSDEDGFSEEDVAKIEARDALLMAQLQAQNPGTAPGGGLCGSSSSVSLRPRRYTRI